MTAHKTSEDISELRKRIQDMLNKACESLGFHLKVQEGVKREDEWIYFIVVPESASEDVSAFDYAKVLSDVELDLRFNQGEEHVLLVPAVED
jgi:hypothetical protein